MAIFPNFTSEKAQTIATAFLSSLVITGVIIYTLSSVFQRLFFVPTLNYKKRLTKASKSNTKKLSRKSIGFKLGAFRRRVILASANPSLYSTGPKTNNYLQLQQPDLGDNFDEFIDRTSPKQISDPSRKIIFGFFHPYCNAGGGGERVLWQAVYQTLKASEKNIAVIYTGDQDTHKEILDNVKKRFDLSFDRQRVVFIYLAKRYLVDDKYWKNWTLLGQAIGSTLLAFEAISALPPDIFLDTMGYPFSYPVVYHLLKIPILSYTHFPIIQTHMLNKLWIQLKTSKSNSNTLKLAGKYVYWKLFMVVYSFIGYYIDIPLCNGSWTFNHLNKIWWMLDGKNKDENVVKLAKLYPPCLTEVFVDETQLEHEISALETNQVKWEKLDNSFVCLAQFRPEKRHELILQEFAKFIDQHNSNTTNSNKNNNNNISAPPRLVLIGSIRNDNDRKFVEKLVAFAESLSISNYVQFILDAPWETVQQYFRQCSFGLNAMWNEHFGIAVVETIASGLIPISHASAGPLLDIAVPWDLKTNSQIDLSNTKSTKDTHEKNNDGYETGLFFQSPTDPDYSDLSKQETQGTAAAAAAQRYPELHEVFAQAIAMSSLVRKQYSVRGKACVLQKFSNDKFNADWDRYLEKLTKYDKYFREQKGKVEQVY